MTVIQGCTVLQQWQRYFFNYFGCVGHRDAQLLLKRPRNLLHSKSQLFVRIQTIGYCHCSPATTLRKVIAKLCKRASNQPSTGTWKNPNFTFWERPTRWAQFMHSIWHTRQWWVEKVRKMSFSY